LTSTSHLLPTLAQPRILGSRASQAYDRRNSLNPGWRKMRTSPRQRFRRRIHRNTPPGLRSRKQTPTARNALLPVSRLSALQGPKRGLFLQTLSWWKESAKPRYHLQHFICPYPLGLLELHSTQAKKYKGFEHGVVTHVSYNYDLICLITAESFGSVCPVLVYLTFFFFIQCVRVSIYIREPPKSDFTLLSLLPLVLLGLECVTF
jgi:hypothetical protein